VQDGLAFHTEIHRLSPVRARPASNVRAFDAQALTSRLREGRQFVVPLRKRASVDALSMERISVGRARNKDVVLRDASVSKFHGWFEMDEYRTFHVADAGSKNGTTLNGKRLEPRQPNAVHAGDVIVFGSIETLVCQADTFWKALNGS
jgi:pSer/pThr/pTyr-binding forkhead associated (FHA) protein